MSGADNKKLLETLKVRAEASLLSRDLAGAEKVLDQALMIDPLEFFMAPYKVYCFADRARQASGEEAAAISSEIAKLSVAYVKKYPGSFLPPSSFSFRRL